MTRLFKFIKIEIYQTPKDLGSIFPETKLDPLHWFDGTRLELSLFLELFLQNNF